MALKLIFMGTPNFAVPILQSIVKDSDHKILSVYTQSPKKSKRGQKINVSAIHKFSNLQNLNVRHPENLDKKEFEYLNNLRPDVVVVFMHLFFLNGEVPHLFKDLLSIWIRKQEFQ